MHKAGLGIVTRFARSSDGNDLDIDIVDNEDRTFILFYTLRNPGNYVIKIKFDRQDILGAYFVVIVCFRNRNFLSFPNMNTFFSLFYTFGIY
jgi:hypothetical protein